MIWIEDLESMMVLFQNYYDKVSTELTELKKKVPDGSRLHAAKHGNAYQYYIRWNGPQREREYIGKERMDEAKTLAQIEYYEKLSGILQHDIKCLNVLKETWSGDPFNWVEENMSRGKYILVTPAYCHDAHFIQEWKEQIYEKMPFKEDSPEFYTRKGVRVRSKSEMIIADMLDEMQIPFLYEKPLKLGAWTIHPDFTLLDIKNRREIYWEHFGMMDDMDYRNDAFLKMRKYEECGFYQCDRLIWTFETGRLPINTKDLRNMIMKLAKSLGYEKV
jgi:hypothetical protein